MIHQPSIQRTSGKLIRHLLIIPLMIAIVTDLIWPVSIASASQPQSNGWVQLANPQAPGGDVVALALAPSDANVLYTLINGQQGGMRFFRSQDAGASWLEIHFFPLSLEYNFNNLAVDPANPQIVYASGGTSLQRSTDGGETWQQANPLGEVFTAVSSSRLYAAGWTDPCGDGYSKVYNLARSDDGGQTWQTFPIGCLDQSSGAQLAVLPAQPDTVYLSIASEGTLLKSTDAGQTWSIFTPPIYDAATALLIDPANPQRLFASGTYGILRSENGGETWQRNSPQSMGIYHCLAISGGSLFAVERTNSKAPVYRSDDGGTTWWQSVTLVPAGALVLQADPVHPGRLWGGLANYGIYLIGDSGGSWVEKNTGILTPALINALAVSPSDRDIIYAAVNYPYPGVYRSSDGGQTWTPPLSGFTGVIVSSAQEFQSVSSLRPEAVNTWYPLLEIYKLLVDPMHPEIAWAATSSGIYETTDGVDWVAKLPYMPITDLAVSPADPDHPYAAMRDSQNNAYLAHRFCDTPPLPCYWRSKSINSGQLSIPFLWVNPSNPQHLLTTGAVNTPAHNIIGIFENLNGGGVWSKIGEFTAAAVPVAMAIAPQNSHQMIMSLVNFITDRSLLFRSQDGGTTWQDLSSGMPVSYGPGLYWPLAIDELGSSYLGEDGVYRQQLSQTKWQPIGLQGHEIQALYFYPSPGPRLFAVGDGSAWRLDLPPIHHAWLPLVKEAGQ